MFATGKREIADLEICIVDSDTGMPLSNISVLYFLAKGKPIYFVDCEYIVIAGEKYTTDENGIIRVPQRKVYLKWREFLSSIVIYINIDIGKDMNTGKELDEDYQIGLWINFYRNTGYTTAIYPNPDYYSAYAFMSFTKNERRIYTQINNENKFYDRTQERIDFYNRDEKQRIIIELVNP
jgi:hypothetical protein